MVHQHFMLIPVMTVVENIVLGDEPQRHGQLDLDTARRARARAVDASYGLAVDPDAVIEEIGVGQQQRVEILKALYRDARMLILDEPTAVLTPQEVDELFAVLRTLVAGGTSIILITHKLHEVLEVADRISVLRRGKKVATIDREGATERSLAELMVGREVLLDVARGPAHPGDDGARGARSVGARRPRSRRRARALDGRARGRDRRHRGRRRQRPERADPGASPACARRTQGSIELSRRRR